MGLNRKGNSLGPYLRDWGTSVAPRIRVFNYDQLRTWREFPSATYIFTGVAGLTGARRAWAIELWKHLASAGKPVRLLNDPSVVLGRYELLRKLRDMGVNTHQAYRLREAHRARFPVFLRRERKHTGTLTRLIRSRPELMRAVVWAYRRGVPMNDLLVVEFCDTADADGNYHKYSAFFVDGRVVPRNLIFRPGWMVKEVPYPATPVPEHVARGREYLETNPHESWIREIFSVARIDYGRIDYGMREGSPAIWEINTDPTPMSPAHPQPAYMQHQNELFTQAFDTALEALDTDSVVRSPATRMGTCFGER